MPQLCCWIAKAEGTLISNQPINSDGLLCDPEMIKRSRRHKKGVCRPENAMADQPRPLVRRPCGNFHRAADRLLLGTMQTYLREPTFTRSSDMPLFDKTLNLNGM